MRTRKPTVNVIIDKSKKNKDGKCPLQILVCWGGERKKESLGISIGEDGWKRGEYRGNKRVSARLEQIYQRIDELSSCGGKYTLNDVMEKIVDKGTNLKKIMYEMVSAKKLEFSTQKTYNNAVVSFGKYFGEDCDINKINKEQIQGYARSIKVSPGTVGLYLKRLHSLFEFGVTRGYIDANPLKGWKFVREGYKSDDNPHSASLEDIKKYEKIFWGTDDKYIKESIGIWLSGYYFCGMALADIMVKNWNEVKEEKINGKYVYHFKIRRRKTREVANVWCPVTPLTKELLKLLQNEPWKGKSCYLQMVNKHLKKIDENLHYYTCRHSFATKMVNNGVPINTIASLLGRGVNGIAAYVQKIEDENSFMKSIFGKTEMEEGEALF